MIAVASASRVGCRGIAMIVCLGSILSTITLELMMAARRSLPKPKPPMLRGLLLHIPEDKLLQLSAEAKEADSTVHDLCGKILLDWLA